MLPECQDALVEDAEHQPAQERQWYPPVGARTTDNEIDEVHAPQLPDVAERAQGPVRLRHRYEGDDEIES